MKYRVSWKSKATGHEGHGKWSTDKKAIQEAVDHGNEQDAVIEHWVESEKSE